MLTTIRLDSKGDLVKVAEYLLNYAPLKEATSIYDSFFTCHSLTASINNES